MKYFLSIIFLITSLFCAAQKREVVRKSVIKLEGRNTNIRDLIEINGYYSFSDHPNYGNYMFFEDGSWVYFTFKNDISENEIRANMSKSVVNWTEGKQIRWGSYWGVYNVKNDTLIVYRYDKGSLWKGWSLSENRYKVIDRETIQRIYCKGLLKLEDNYYETHNPWLSEMPMSFMPADSIPSSDNWLKEEKWIWRNESDWKDYMHKREEKKIKPK